MARMVHHLVLEAFIGRCPEGMYACHNNDIKTDNCLSNLRWDTPEANWGDRFRNGRVGNLSGERHPLAKLTANDVREIRYRASKGEWASALAREFGVSYGTVRSIITGRTWVNPPLETVKLG